MPDKFAVCYSTTREVHDDSNRMNLDMGGYYEDNRNYAD